MKKKPEMPKNEIQREHRAKYAKHSSRGFATTYKYTIGLEHIKNTRRLVVLVV